MRGRIRVEGDHPRRPVVSHRFAEEAFRRGDIPSFAQLEVHCSPVFVNGSIEVGPTALHLYIGLITSPGTVNRSSTRSYRPCPVFLLFVNSGERSLMYSSML